MHFKHTTVKTLKWRREILIRGYAVTAGQNRSVELIGTAGRTVSFMHADDGFTDHEAADI